MSGFEEAMRATIEDLLGVQDAQLMSQVGFLAALLALWIIPAFGAAWLAEQRGRSALAWLIVGLLIGPLGVLLVGFAPIKEPLTNLRCPACQSRVLSGATRCRWCATDWDTPAADARIPLPRL